MIILLILLTMTGMMFFAQNYIRRIERSNAETLAQSLLKQTDDALDNYLQTLRYHAVYLCRYSFVQDFCLGTVDNRAVREAQLSSIYSQIAMQEHEIIGAAFYDSDMQPAVSMGQEFTLPEKQRYLRREQDLNADWYFGDEESYNYAFYYPVYDNSIGLESRQIGMCVFLLDHWLFEGVVMNILGDTSAAVLLSDSHNLNLSYHTAGDTPEDRSIQDLKADADYVCREGTWQNGIRIAAAVSISGNTEGSRTVSRPLLYAIGIAVVLLGILLYFSYYQLVRPIHTINRFIRRAGKHPDDRLNMKRTDDIGAVAASLDRMLDENQNMIEEIRSGKIRLYETQLAREKMEIMAYRNQINPHFLYNTLSCIRDMALIDDEDAIAEIAMALSDIFRYAVKGSNIVTVRDEVEYLAKYAKIIEYRFMGKMRIEIVTAPELMDCQVIRFLLQPLVENAVFHGLEHKLEPGVVEVQIREGAEDRLQIVVKDDGCGMTAEQLEQLRTLLKRPEESTGIGISNIVNRLRLFYGADYEMTADSAPGKGTEIRILVPERITEEEQPAEESSLR